MGAGLIGPGWALMLPALALAFVLAFVLLGVADLGSSLLGHALVAKGLIGVGILDARAVLLAWHSCLRRWRLSDSNATKLRCGQPRDYRLLLAARLLRGFG